MARGQSSHGSIGVSAVILAPPPTATVFVRVPDAGDKTRANVFVAAPRVHEPKLLLRLPAATRDTTVRLERLITAGT